VILKGQWNKAMKVSKLFVDSALEKDENREFPERRRLQLVAIISTVVAVTAIVSHILIIWFKIETSPSGHWIIGSGGGSPSTFMAGSSLAGDGLEWSRIANELHLRIQGWGVAGSSPCEWEPFQHIATQIKLTFIVISPYDMNEYFLSDFRADLVPLIQSIEDLRGSGAEWPFSKRLLSMYPMTYVRALFPTVGRSNGVIVGAREELVKLAGGVLFMQSEAGPTLSFEEGNSTQSYKTETISDWSPARTLRRLAEMRSACQGIHSFNGPKKLALHRMLVHAVEQGSAIVVVLPVSPIYGREFLTPEVMDKFEETLSNLQISFPQTHWIRLDRMHELHSNAYFWDLVHMNTSGREIATQAFLTRISEPASLP
jgi:hypothetical protein